MIPGISAQQAMIVSESPPVPVGVTKLLAHFDGTNGSPIFVDEVGNPLTAYGGAVVSTLQSKFGGASLLCNRTRAVLTPYSSDFAMAGVFTFDFWVRFSSVSGNAQYFLSFSTESGAPFYLIRPAGASSLISYIIGGAGYSQTPVPVNTWAHILFSQDAAGVLRFFLNGALQEESSAALRASGATKITIGSSDPVHVYGDGYGLSGNIDEFRFLREYAQVEPFTPPAAPYLFP